jgi:hypothetical protein
MIAEVAEELGRLDCRDWDKSLRGEKDGVKRFLKNLAIRELKVFGWLMCRCVPSTKRASPGRGQMQEQWAVRPLRLPGGSTISTTVTILMDGFIDPSKSNRGPQRQAGRHG